MKNALTMTLIFEANSANYGEGFSNISPMKTLTRGDYKEYPYISRQALRYNMVEQLNWNTTPVSGEIGAVQFTHDTTIKDYPELDLFGYMKTAKKTDNHLTKKRSAVVRLSHAIGLEPYKGDIDYLTNIGLSKRGSNMDNSIVLTEIQRSFYSYTITIDLDLIGIDENDNIEISQEEKTKRIIDFLSTVEFLYRDIKGRRENLSPIFAIGGLYSRKNPFFMNSISLEERNLQMSSIQDLLKIEEIAKNTYTGLLNGIFTNEKAIKENLNPISIHEFFNQIKKEVTKYYETN
ncbi:MAG: type I-B CRISPR-associated protein Cas7/Cst2/DevR [Bacilli bacterium]|nr:type I-B CRISPR-associated protein Cas7/Cst2/DevR [Bacilli bacterium]